MNTPNFPATIDTDQTPPGSENCLPLGMRLAEFEITGIIGEGGFGIVYQAFDHSLQRTVAIKEYMPSTLAGRGPDNTVMVRSKRQQETFDTGLRSFIQEARLLAQFDHPALIKVYRFWEENKTAYMAMRRYEGVTLKSVIENGTLPVTEAWLKSLLKPLLEALSALYQAKILHRDVSPDNIIIQRNGKPVLLDFGAARQILGGMTQTLTVILKPGYAPIEQYADDSSMKQGPWTDIYSLAAVVYALIVKKPPPTSVARMIEDPIETLQAGQHAGFSPEFLVAIDRGLAVRPENRPQSINEFRVLLGISRAPSAPAERGPAAIAPNSSAPSNPSGESGQPTSRAPAKSSATAAPDSARPSATAAVPGPARPAGGPAKLAWTALIAGILLAAGSAGYLALRHRLEPGVPAAPASLSSTPAAAAPSSVTASISAAANQTTPAATLNTQAADEETSAWEALFDENPVNPDSVEKFLKKYPSGRYAGLAQAKLTELRQNPAARHPLAIASNAKEKAVPLDRKEMAVPLANPGSPKVETHTTLARPQESPAPIPTTEALDKDKPRSADEEAIAWQALQNRPDPKPMQFRAFMRRFPNSPHIEMARARWAELRARRAETQSQDEGFPQDAKRQEETTKKGVQTIKISIKPWGNVLLDGTERGVSPPMKKLTISEGKHQIRIVNPNFPDYVVEVDSGKRRVDSIEYDFSPNKK